MNLQNVPPSMLFYVRTVSLRKGWRALTKELYGEKVAERVTRETAVSYLLRRNDARKLDPEAFQALADMLVMACRSEGFTNWATWKALGLAELLLKHR